MNPLHAALIAQTSAMRLIAERIRVASPDGPVEAAILLHEAERTELRALGEIGPHDEVTRLRSVVERCGLLIEARNPSVVLHHRWPEVLSQADRCTSPFRQIALERLRPSVENMKLERQRLLGRLKRLRQPLPVAIAGTPAQRSSLIRALGTYLGVFPGDWGAWQILALLEHLLSTHPAAWRSISIARRMEPSAGAALELNIAVDALTSAELRAMLEESFSGWTGVPDDPELAFAVANACVALAQRTAEGRAELLTRAAVCADRGILYVHRDDRMHRSFRALLLIVEMLQQGRAPDPSVFDRAGLPELAASSADADPIVTLRRETGAVPRGIAA